MRRINKHQVTKISFADFSGGINVSRPPEQISEIDMQKCENFIYDKNSARLIGRGGIGTATYTFPAATDIKDLFYDVETNLLFATMADRTLYSITPNSSNAMLLGSLIGTEYPMFVRFNNKLWIASGGHLQYYDVASGLNTVTQSPVCDMVFQRFARLLVTLVGSDRLNYSSIGDGTTWEENTNMASEGQWVDVGNYDSGNIISIVPLATDIMIIKSNGIVYQFVGDASIDTWQINPVATNTDPVGKQTAVNIGSNVVFLSERGLKSLATVMDYGNISASDIGNKFNKLITKNLYNPRVFHLKRHMTILIRPYETDKTYYISYNYGVGAATVLKFGVPITSIVETNNDIIASSGSSLFTIKDENINDNGVKISYLIMPKNTIGSDKLLVKAVDSKLYSDHAGNVCISTEALKINAPTNIRKKVKCNHSTDCISIEIKSNDRFEFECLALDIADI